MIRAEQRCEHLMRFKKYNLSKIQEKSLTSSNLFFPIILELF